LVWKQKHFVFCPLSTVSTINREPWWSRFKCNEMNLMPFTRKVAKFVSCCWETQICSSTSSKTYLACTTTKTTKQQFIEVFPYIYKALPI